VDQAVSVAIPDLEVVARCECGCASVDFERSTSQERSGIFAEATGRTPRGGQVGVIVWGRSDTITALEIYDLGAGDNDLVLRVLTSVIPGIGQGPL
jgi:hypothetical protein